MEFTNQFKVPPGEIRARTRSIQRELGKNDIEGLFVVQRVDLFYFSGTAQNGFMYIPAEGVHFHVHLFAGRKLGPMLTR